VVQRRTPPESDCALTVLMWHDRGRACGPVAAIRPDHHDAAPGASADARLPRVGMADRRFFTARSRARRLQARCGGDCGQAAAARQEWLGASVQYPRSSRIQSAIGRMNRSVRRILRLCRRTGPGLLSVLAKPWRTHSVICSVLGATAIKLFRDQGFDGIITDVVSFGAL
jgi:hypothetical protein